MTTPSKLVPDWRWGTAEGSREFDRWCDRELSFLEKVRWLEEAEALSLTMRWGSGLAHFPGPSEKSSGTDTSGL